MILIGSSTASPMIAFGVLGELDIGYLVNLRSKMSDSIGDPVVDDLIVSVNMHEKMPLAPDHRHL